MARSNMRSLWLHILISVISLVFPQPLDVSALGTEVVSSPSPAHSCRCTPPPPQCSSLVAQELLKSQSEFSCVCTCIYREDNFSVGPSVLLEICSLSAAAVSAILSGLQASGQSSVSFTPSFPSHHRGAEFRHL